MQRSDYTTKTNEELVNLFRSTSDDRKRMRCLTTLYQNNYLYFLKICRKYSGYEDIDDLMQEAFIGLRIAVDKYDSEKEIPFINYASIWIEAEINKYLDNCGSVVRMPSYMRSQNIRYSKVKRAFTMKYGREPSDQELKALLLLNDEQLMRLKKCLSMVNAESLDKVISNEDNSITVRDTVADPIDHYSELIDEMDDEQMRRTVWEEVNKLSEEETEILKEYYIQKKSFVDMAEEHRCTYSHIQKIKNGAIKKLRKSKRINRYADEYTTAKAYTGTGFFSFVNSGFSAPERVAIKNIDRNISSYKRNVERKIRKGIDKEGNALDDKYILDQAARYAVN